MRVTRREMTDTPTSLDLLFRREGGLETPQGS
jgi:hypothetical protein